MSTATYPQGMKPNNPLPQGGYKSWKGKGIYKNPVGVVSTHIRPLTNNDTGNIFPSPFGRPRPIKHYRKGRNIPTYANISNDTNTNKQIDYNLNRAVKSSMNSSLGGGGGGNGLITTMIDTPGQVNIKNNDNNTECIDCNGVTNISNWAPNNNLSETPNGTTENCTLCCNQEKNALRRTRPASTNVSKNYYQTTKAYLQNRCLTYKQRSFNFSKGVDDRGEVLYVAQCAPNCNGDSKNIVTEYKPDNNYCTPSYVSNGGKGCSRVYYKPNNKQFAVEGAVSSSSRILKLNVDTITKNYAINKSHRTFTEGGKPTTPFIYKEKTPPCNPATYIGNPFFFQGQFQNKNICNKQ